MDVKKSKPLMTDIAIVGIGCLFPKANNLSEYWSHIREGVDAITDIPDTHWAVDHYFDTDQAKPDMTYAQHGGFIDPYDFDPLFYGISPNNIEATDTTQLLGMAVAHAALLDAGYATTKKADDGKAFDRDRTSVILGVTGTLELVIPLGARLGHPLWRKALKDAGVDSETAEDVVRRIADGYVPWQENSFPGLLGNVAAGRIANRFDLGGTNCVVDAACASSLSAIHLTALELSAGRVDMAITGGMDTFNDIFMYMCFSKTPALSPTGHSRPFAKDGDGTILGEGLGAVVMKRLDDARRDNDKIYAVLKGMGSSSDGRGNAIYAPSANGQIKALEHAYQIAGVTPRSIELIEAHGTGTAVGDAVEATALNQVYRQDQDDSTWCAIGSVKSMIGHTKAAAGIAGLIKIAMALKHKVLPPSIKVEEPLDIIWPGTAPIYLNTIKRPWLKTLTTPRRAAISAFGFGGSNFHCVLEEVSEKKNEIDWDGHTLIVAISAGSKSELIKKLPADNVLQNWNRLRCYAFASCQSFSVSASCRLTVVMDKEQTDSRHLFDKVRDYLKQDKSLWSLPGVTFSDRDTQHKIALIFPGQGAQYVGMGRDLACQFPVFFEAIHKASTAFSECAKEQLSDIIYPVPVFSKADKKQQDDKLRQTQYAQPAIGAVSFAGLKLLEYFDIHADMAAGHSYGELTAMCAARYYDPASFYQLSYQRGELMRQKAREKGAMIAVFASEATLSRLLKRNQIALSIANYNAPEQLVLSGAVDQIEQCEIHAKKNQIRTVRLPVAGAFHSDFIKAAVKPFAMELNKVKLQKKTMPVLSCATGEPYPDGHDAIKKLLAEQLVQPVRFVQQIKRLYQDGVDIFIEPGPGNILSGLVREILFDAPITALSIDASSGKKTGQHDLAMLLAKLAALGVNVALDKWDDNAFIAKKQTELNKKSVMTIPICGANTRHAEKPTPKMKHIAQSTMKKSDPPNTQHHVADSASQNAPRADVTDNHHLLSTIEHSILSLQKMQAHTAELHQQYLAGQESAQQTIQRLLEQVQYHAPVARVNKPDEKNRIGSDWNKQPETGTPVMDVQSEQKKERSEAVTEVGRQTIDVENLVLKVVAEKTGYPSDMLSLDMHLDADLGIDSIKRVEIFSVLQNEVPWGATIKPEDMGTIEYLQHIVDFIAKDRSEDQLSALPEPSLHTATDKLDDILLDIVAEKTGYPAEMLELDMHLDADLGIDSIKRVEILSALQARLPHLPTVNADELARLSTLNAICEYFNGAYAHVTAENTSKEKKKMTGFLTQHQDQIVRSVVTLTDIRQPREAIEFDKKKHIWINANGGDLAKQLVTYLKHQGYTVSLVDHQQKQADRLGALFICATNEPDKQWTIDTFKLMQLCSPGLIESNGILASITTLGGSFGIDKRICASPHQAAVHGMIKTADKEWGCVTCKSIDIDLETVAFDHICRELFLSGPLEVGLKNEQVVQIELKNEAIPTVPVQHRRIHQTDTILLTGGARGIAAEVAIRLAEVYQCRLLLLGRSPTPENEPDWLVHLADEADIKQAILDHATASLSPVDLEKQYQSVLAHREIKTTLNKIAMAGAHGLYQSADVNQPDALEAALRRAQIKPDDITGVIHAAGVLADRLIKDKTEQQFDLVYSTKVTGLQNILNIIDHDQLKLIVLFSSTTARFGRKGQVDYAAANEVMNKIAQREQSLRRDCKVLSVNFGPWNGGMVTPALKTHFAEEGVGVIDLSIGADYFIGELEADGPVEVVVIAKPECHDSSQFSIAFQQTLSVKSHDFLTSHVINGQAVLPVAVMLEWFAHAALHANPGLQFHGFDHFRLFKGVTLKAHENIELNILAGDTQFGDQYSCVSVELRSNQFLHASAVVILTSGYVQNVSAKLKTVEGAYRFRQREFYQNGQLFHGQHLHGIDQVLHCNEAGITASVHAAPAPSAWVKQPLRSNWLTDPLMLDCAFQLMILWSLEHKGIASLPTSIGRYRQYQRSFPKHGARVVIEVTESTAHLARAAVEFIDHNDSLIAAIDDYECILDDSLTTAFQHNHLACKPD